MKGRVKIWHFHWVLFKFSVKNKEIVYNQIRLVTQQNGAQQKARVVKLY